MNSGKQCFPKEASPRRAVVMKSNYTPKLDVLWKFGLNPTNSHCITLSILYGYCSHSVRKVNQKNTPDMSVIRAEENTEMTKTVSGKY